MKKYFSSIIGNCFRFKRFNIFILFLFLSFLISIVSKLSKNITRTISIEVIPINVPVMEVLTENKSKFIDVTINSQGFNILKYSFKKIEFFIDINDLKKDSLKYYWDGKIDGYKISKIFDESTKINGIYPNIFSFTYDSQSLKKIPVFLNSSIKFSSGYDLIGNLSVIPDSINIIGPKRIIDTVNNVTTSKFELIEQKENINSSIELDTYNDLIIYSDSLINVSGIVDRFTEGKLNIPVNVINLPSNLEISIFPKLVPITYYTNLDSYNDIDITDFEVVCDFAFVNKEGSVLFPKLVSYPKSVIRASIQLAKLEYVITKKL